MSGERDRTERDTAADTRVYTLYQEGQDRLLNGRPREAAALLEQAVEEEPQKASLHETLARAYFASARVETARQSFEAALELDPSNDYAHFGVGRCFERLGLLSDAAKHYKLACALADRLPYRAALDRVLRRLSDA